MRARIRKVSPGKNEEGPGVRLLGRSGGPAAAGLFCDDPYLLGSGTFRVFVAFGSCQVGACEFGACEIACREIGSNEIDSSEVDSCEHGAFEIDP